MSENGPALYGPSGGSTPAETTEIWYPFVGLDTTDSGLSNSSTGIAYFDGDDCFATVGARIPASWSSFDVVLVVQSDTTNPGDLVLAVYQATSVVFGPKPLLGSVTIPGASVQATPTAVTLASGVSVAGEFVQIIVGLDGQNVANTYADFAAGYGVLLRKVS